MYVDVVDPERARRLPWALLAYAGALAAFLLLPPILHATVGPPGGFTLQEAVDLFTPIVVLPLAWWALDCLGGLRPVELLIFLIIAIVWVEGQATHLATNAIGDVFARGAARDEFYATEAGDLDHWFDEVLSHWLWHLAWAALSVFIVAVATRRREWPRGPGRLSAAAGAVHGATFFFVTTEGETALLGIPLSVVLLGWTARETAAGSRNPAIRFFLVSSVVTLTGYLVWAALNRWQLVEPCSVIGC
ncbi:MAG TPA: hypothetical protein VFV72_05245 [Candidatus Limnocylindrales bacterium]|nr:hypothetical protein [Candidatus Limnocylindrales bacterium]